MHAREEEGRRLRNEGGGTELIKHAGFHTTFHANLSEGEESAMDY